MRMGRNHLGRLIVGTGCLIIVLTWMFARSHAQQRADQSVAIDNDDVGGVVTSSNGPEAGVWVIAETRELPVRYIKTVVTDDRGGYLVPDLPKAKYSVWVRGYGLVDSPKVTSEPGKQLNLTATVAPNEAAAAQYYPAIYWYSMLHIPGQRSVRRQAWHPGQVHTKRLAEHHEEQWLYRMPSARAALDAHATAGFRRNRVFRAGLDAARPVRTGRGADV